VLPDSLDPFDQVEGDVRRLMLELSKARFASQENDTLRKEEIRKHLLEIIEVSDAFDRVFRNIGAKQDLITPQMKIWLGNFRTIRQLVERIVANAGVVPIQNLEDGFDPHWHKVAGVTADPSKPDGTIIDEVRRGYFWNNQVLRKTEVTIVGDPSDAEDAEGDA
jgi:molecular chaperone GrpE (heat shock protein)